MSKETFWEDAKDTLYPIAVIEQVIKLIEAHNGTIFWEQEPKEPVEPAVCTCEGWLILELEDYDFDKPGPWHLNECPLWTPF